MTSPQPLLRLNSALDWPALGRELRRDRRIQIRDVLEPEAATAIARQLAERTPWGLAWSAPDTGTQKLPAEQVAGLRLEHHAAMKERISAAMSGQGFSFMYGQYLLHDRYVLGQPQDPFYDRLVEEFNEAPFLDAMRGLASRTDIAWADSQATLYAPGHFLSLHQDVVPGENRILAYVLNLCTVDWRPDWGGYLNFFDNEGNVTAGYRPLFNSLNMFFVPQHHSVTFVPGFAPVGRFAITGWLRGGEKPPEIPRQKG